MTIFESRNVAFNGSLCVDGDRIGVVIRTSMGSVNITASDKTGTLTKNVMTVTDCWYYDEVVNGAPKPDNAGDKTGIGAFDSPVRDLLEIMCVCNASKFDHEDSTAIEMESSLINEVENNGSSR